MDVIEDIQQNGLFKNSFFKPILTLESQKQYKMTGISW